MWGWSFTSSAAWWEAARTAMKTVSSLTMVVTPSGVARRVGPSGPRYGIAARITPR